VVRPKAEKLREALRLIAGERAGFDPEDDDPGSIISYGLCRAVVSVLSDVSQANHDVSCHSDRVVFAGR